MRFGSLRSRIAAWFAGIVVVALSAAAAASYTHVRQALRETTDRGLAIRARALGDLVLPGAAGPAADARSRGTWSRRTPFRGFLVRDAATGAPIQWSASLDDLPATRAVLDSLPIPERKSESTHEVVGAGRFRVVQVRREAGGRAFAVAIAEDDAESAEELFLLGWGFAGGLAASLAAVLACAWFAARRITTPIRDLARYAERAEVGGGDPAPAHAEPHEVARLRGTLERTFGRLRASLDRQRRFTSDASHELRTPLAAILTETELALMRPRTADEHRLAIERIAGSARGLHATVESLLLLARLDAGGPAVGSGPADAAAALRSAADAVARRAAERGATLRIGDGAPVLVAGDPDLLAIAFRNILENAVEHGREGGRVEARLDREGASVRVAIEDDGPGIPPEALPRVFEPFFRADPARGRSPGGAGLGLSIAERIVRALGGSISVESGPGRGTVVTVRLRGDASEPAVLGPGGSCTPLT